MRNKKTLVPTGETILEFLDAYNMTQQDLAIRTNIHPKTINEIIKGKAPVTPETAMKLEYVLNQPFSFWMNLEMFYREELLRRKEEEESLKEINEFKKFPNKLLKESGLVIESSSIEEQVINLKKFLGVPTLNSDTILNKKIYYRKYDSKNFSKESLICWLRVGELSAIDVDTLPFDKEKLKQAIIKIRKLANHRFMDEMESIKKILAYCGVVLVYYKLFPNTNVNGVSYKLTPKKALIMLSGRGNKDDSVWFTLFHELCHLLKHSQKELFIDGDSSEINEEELEADEFAKNTLIDKKEYQKFIQKEKIDVMDIMKFSTQNNINTGILVGRLQSDKIIEWNKFTELKFMFTND